MERIPKGWMFTLGLSVLAVVAAMVASTVTFPTKTGTVVNEDGSAYIDAESCFRYGRLECCVKSE
jgi:hypothetical protein